MADLLALEWENEQLCGVQARVTAGQVRIRRCFQLKKPDDLDLADAKRAGVWLKEQLTQYGIKTEPVCVTLPRDEAVVKRLELPDAPDDELPALVRFQAGAKSSQPLGELSLDFLPLPLRDGVTGREVLMATIPRKAVEEIRGVCERAGLYLTALGLAPVAIAELVVRREQPPSEDAHAASLVVSRHGSRVEIFVIRRGHLLFAHSTRLSPEDDNQTQQAIIAEMFRALVALQGLHAAVKITQVWMLVDPADHHGGLAEHLSRRLGCPVEALDPFATVEWERHDAELPRDRSLFAGPVGMLLSKSGALAPAIDFLAPRQPPVKRDPRKRRNVMLAAGAVAAAVVLAGSYALWLHDLNKKIEDLQKDEGTLAAAVKRGEPVLKQADLVQQWSDAHVVWLDEMLELTRRIKTDRIYLSTIRFDPQTGQSLAKVGLQGYARGRNDVTKLDEEFLKSDEQYKIQPHDIPPAKGDSYYPWKLDSEVIVLKPNAKRPGQTKSATKGTLAASADEGKKR